SFIPLLKDLETREVLAIGSSAKEIPENLKMHIHTLADEKFVARAHLQHLFRKGKVETLVVANPADFEGKGGGMSVLAPWVALQYRAVLLLTNARGDNVDDVVRRALEEKGLEHVDSLILVASLKAIPTKRRPNPAAGKDTEIEM